MLKKLWNAFKKRNSKPETVSIAWGFKIEALYSPHGNVLKGYITKVKETDGSLRWIYDVSRQVVLQELRNAIKLGADLPPTLIECNV